MLEQSMMVNMERERELGGRESWDVETVVARDLAAEVNAGVLCRWVSMHGGTWMQYPSVMFHYLRRRDHAGHQRSLNGDKGTSSIRNSLVFVNIQELCYMNYLLN